MKPKQQKFVDEYLIDLNGSQAAIRAGFSPKAANRTGSRLLSRVDIQAAIAKGRAIMSKRTGITQDRVLTELAKIGFSDIRKVLTPDGNVQSPHDWDDDTAGAISSFEVVASRTPDGSEVTESVHKFKVWDKLSALEKIGKHLGMFKVDVARTDTNIEISPAKDLKEYIDAIAKRRGNTE
jgi:phage terminase small subunit